MAPWLFSKAIMKGEPIRLFNHGDMSRDFTFIDDIAEGTVRALHCVATPNNQFNHADPVSDTSSAPYRIFNIGNQQPVPLLDFVKTLEDALGHQAHIILEPLQAGDVLHTMADTQSLHQATGYQPTTTLRQGLAQWAAWFLSKGQHFK
jgi:UDP-glucuronate 4-epimerase